MLVTQISLQSVSTPIEQSRTYRSARTTENRLAHANFMWRQLRQLARVVHLEPGGVLRKLVEHATNEMAERMAAERVAAEEHRVDSEDNRPDTDAKGRLTRNVGEPHRLPDVVAQDEQEEDGEVKKIAMDVLQDERKRLLTEYFFRGSPTAHEGGSAQNAL